MSDPMAYVHHEKIARLLMAEYMCGPPSGYGRVTLEQVARADYEIFAMSQAERSDGVQRMAGGQTTIVGNA